MKKKIVLLTLTAALLLAGCGNSENTVTEKETATESSSMIQQEAGPEIIEPEPEIVESNSHIDNGFDLYEVGVDEKIIDIGKDGYFLTNSHIYHWDYITDESIGLKLSIEPERICENSSFTYVLIIENKDGTYSFCDVNAFATSTTVFDDFEVTNELLVEGIAIKDQHEVVSATCSWSKGCIYFNTLCDGKLYITKYDKDGNIDAEINYVEMKLQVEDEEAYLTGEIKDYVGGYLEDYVLFSDGTLYETDMGSTIYSVDVDDETNIKTYYSSCEIAETDVASIFNDEYDLRITKQSDLNSLYIEDDYDFDQMAYTYEIFPMPEGYTINDISSMCNYYDEIYLITKDQKVMVYEFRSLGDDEYGDAWGEDTYLTEMMANTELIRIAAFDEVEFLFSDGKIYNR